MLTLHEWIAQLGLRSTPSCAQIIRWRCFLALLHRRSWRIFLTYHRSPRHTSNFLLGGCMHEPDRRKLPGQPSPTALVRDVRYRLAWPYIASHNLPGEKTYRHGREVTPPVIASRHFVEWTVVECMAQSTSRGVHSTLYDDFFIWPYLAGVFKAIYWVVKTTLP